LLQLEREAGDIEEEKIKLASTGSEHCHAERVMLLV